MMGLGKDKEPFKIWPFFDIYVKFLFFFFFGVWGITGKGCSGWLGIDF